MRYTLSLDNTPDQIVGLYWLAKDSDGEFTAESEGYVKFDPSHPINRVPYESLTEDDCLAVLFDLMGEQRERIEQGIADRLARQGVPLYGEGKPWKGAQRQWRVGLDVVAGEYLAFEGTYYRVLQPHTTQSDWPPPKTPALFTQEDPPDVVNGPQPWVQPTGAHDAYARGAQVTHNGRTWESEIDGNVWEPGAPGTAALWTEVT